MKKEHILAVLIIVLFVSSTIFVWVFGLYHQDQNFLSFSLPELVGLSISLVSLFILGFLYSRISSEKDKERKRNVSIEYLLDFEKRNLFETLEIISSNSNEKKLKKSSLLLHKKHFNLVLQLLHNQKIKSKEITKNISLFEAEYDHYSNALDDHYSGKEKDFTNVEIKNINEYLQSAILFISLCTIELAKE